VHQVGDQTKVLMSNLRMIRALPVFPLYYGMYRDNVTFFVTRILLCVAKAPHLI